MGQRPNRGLRLHGMKSTCVNCKTREKFIFSEKNGKTVISVENKKFSRSRMMKQTSPLNSFCEI